MFTLQDVELLKAALKPVSFSAAAAGLPAEGVEEAARETLITYLRHYGLDLTDVPHQHHFGYFDAAGYRLAAHCFVPSAARPGSEQESADTGPASSDQNARGTVFILHGYFDHIGLYRHVIRYFLQQNFFVVAFDLPGHGLSSGEQVAIDSFARYREVFSACLGLAHQAGLPEPWYIWAQSMGAAIAKDYVLHTASKAEEADAEALYALPRIARMFLLGPLVRPRRWWWVKYSYALRQRSLDKVERHFSYNSSDPEFLRFLREDDPLQPRHISAKWVGALIAWQSDFRNYENSDVPVTVFQGDNDGTVDWRGNPRRISNKFPNYRLVELPGARHHLSNESEELRQIIFDAVSEDLAER